MKKHRDDFDIKLAAVMKKNMSNVSASDELIMKTLARVREEENKKQAKVSPLKPKRAGRMPAAMISGIAAAVIALMGVAVVFGVMYNRKSGSGDVTPAQSVATTLGDTTGEVLSNVPIPDHYQGDEAPVGLTFAGLTGRVYTLGAEVRDMFNLKNCYFNGLNDYYRHIVNKSDKEVREYDANNDKIPPRDDIDTDKRK